MGGGGRCSFYLGEKDWNQKEHCLQNHNGKKKTVVTLDWLNAVRERVANGTEEFRGSQVIWSVVTITA